MSKRPFILAVCWMAAFLVALLLDTPIAQFVHTSGLDKAVKDKWWAETIKAPGQFLFTLALAVLLWLFRRVGWKCSVFVVLAGFISGTNVVIKWSVGRMRPYKLSGSTGLHPFIIHPFWHGFPGFLRQVDLCFPSGHACVAFSLAAAVVVVWSRGSWFFIALAFLVGMERVAENAHYLSDVVAAAGYAMLCVWLLHLALADWITAPRLQGFLIKVTPAMVESLEPQPREESVPANNGP